MTPIFTFLMGSDILRFLCAYINPSFLPGPDAFAAFIRVTEEGKVSKYFVDRKGETSAPLTSVFEVNGTFFLGSLRNSFVGHFKENE